MLYCIVGPSGCGKSTVLNELLKKGYKAPNSYTTRPKRFPEETGHVFVTEEEFNKLENKLAYGYFNGHHYCVTEQMISECDFYIVEPSGLEDLKNHGIDFKVIALQLGESKCKARMLSRGDSLEDVLARLENDKVVFRDLYEIYDIMIDANQPVENIVHQIEKYIN